MTSTVAILFFFFCDAYSKYCIFVTIVVLGCSQSGEFIMSARMYLKILVAYLIGGTIDAYY